MRFFVSLYAKLIYYKRQIYLSGIGMDRNPMGRLHNASSIGSLESAVGGLEAFAIAFPDSRSEVVGLMERYSISARRTDRKVLQSAASRIAALGMLEILQGIN
jgi:hypothetical protein